MKLHTLKKVKEAIKTEQTQVKVDEEIAKKSLKAIEKMIEVSKR